MSETDPDFFYANFESSRVTRINQVSRDPPGPNQASFLDMVIAKSQTSEYLFDDLQLADSFTTRLPGDWTFTPMTIASDDNVQFFRKTRAFTLQHFIRLLIARHHLFQSLAGGSGKSPKEGDLAPGIHETLQEVMRGQCQAASSIWRLLCKGLILIKSCFYSCTGNHWNLYDNTCARPARPFRVSCCEL